jgi:hypothetical protein
MRKHINQRHPGQILDTISTGHQCHQVFGSLHKTYTLITNAVVPSVPLAHSLDAGLQLYTKVLNSLNSLSLLLRFITDYHSLPIIIHYRLSFITDYYSLPIIIHCRFDLLRRKRAAPPVRRHGGGLGPKRAKKELDIATI